MDDSAPLGHARVNGEEIVPRPPEFSDEALALLFAQRHGGKLCYVAPWGQWLQWTGTRWKVDDTLLAFDLARATCREASAACNDPRVASALASAKTVASVVRLSKADRKLAATVNQWDTNPWLLNTPDGVVELKTGTIRPHRAEDFITRITVVSPGGECPIWNGFLKRATDGDVAMQKFLQRMAGYSLSGDTSAHALFFLYGTGANGKTVFLDAITGSMGDYHRTAPIETFTASSGDRHPTDLARLRGSRLVTAVETEEGRRWAESRIKQLTGGDTVAARFMRQDFFEFTPQFKLIIAGNHKPGLRTVDEAIRRRFHLLPFRVTIPAAERDLQLKDKLREEWPGILAWAIRGCLEWQQQGLAPPAAVVNATAVYLEAEDAIATWLEECCERDPQAWEASSMLFGSWKGWAENAEEFVGSTKRFVQLLEGRGFQPKKTRVARGFEGLRLIIPSHQFKDQ